MGRHPLLQPQRLRQTKRQCADLHESVRILSTPLRFSCYLAPSANSN